MFAASAAVMTLGVRAAAALGVLVATVTIWVVRLGYDGYVYVSGLGAEGAPTAAAYNTALLCLGLGGILLAATFASRVADAGWRPLLASTARPSLVVAAACFVVASRVPCTAGCPTPASASFTATDAVHLTAAIVGFVLVCVAMLVVAGTETRRPARAGAVASLVLVAGCSATGGLLALGEVEQQFGAWLEFAAMTVAVLWFVAHVSAAPLATPVSDLRRRPADTEIR